MATLGTKKGTEKATGGITSRSIKNGTILGKKLHPDVASGKWFQYFGKGQPLLFTEAGTAFPTASDNQADLAVLPGCGIHLHYTQLGAATALGPAANALGLKISLDATNAEGAQYVPGGLLGPWLMTVERTAGQTPDKGRFMRARFVITDVSGAGSLACGFRKSEAIQDDPQDYDEGAFFQVVIGTINIVKILTTTPVSVDTTQDWADTEEHELEVRVGGSGLVSFLLDGDDVTSQSAQFQFADAEAIVPFFDYKNEAGSTSAAYLTYLECGTLEQV
jgi:hypothetical protein